MADLMAVAPVTTPVYYVDPNPATSLELQFRKSVHIIEHPASSGVKEVVDLLFQQT